MTELGARSGLARATGQGQMRRSNDFVWRHRNLLRLGITVAAVFADLIALLLACLLGTLLRHGDFDAGNSVETFILVAPIYLLAAVALRAYRPSSLRSLGRSLFSGTAAFFVATSIALSAAFALKVGTMLSRLETGYAVLLALWFLVIVRVVGVYVLRRLFRSVIEPRLIVLTDGFGADGSDDRLTQLVNVRQINLRPALGDPQFFDRVSRTVRDADRVILSFSNIAERLKWAEAMRLSGLDAEIVADLGDVKPLALSHWRSHTTLVISRGPLNLGERVTKRAFDIAVASGILFLAGPIIALAAVLVKLDSRGPVFFVQERVGRNNRTYRCFKLRTMRIDAIDAAGEVSTARNDERVTRIGRFLRRTSIDELPQLFNVLRGDMSLVGPRPHALGSRAEGALFWELVPDYWTRHSMKPGVTGLAQIRGYRGATHNREAIVDRVAADLEYINSWSLWLDIKILVKTVRVAIHHNAY